MRLPALFRRRSVWLPTPWGWLLLVAMACGAGILVVRNIHSFLAMNDPVGARTLVVEGWLEPNDLDRAAQAFASGRYERVVTTGAPIKGWQQLVAETTYAQVAADHLAAHGVPRDVICVVPAPESAQERTFLSAVMVREWAEKSSIALDEIDLFSAGTHARRSRLMFQAALGPGVRVGVLTASPTEYDAQAWWRSSAGTKDVVVETLGLLWAKLVFSPPPRGSHEERWAVPRTSGVK